ncbi:MFS transporter [Marinomonas transparens]|uniref:MFS transporter n=1 Tax=Marinomonas transparens TaxID=2795388 RepID=A0A934JLR8_9GAMM|nr:MFS transporter [Marinomonas transparens]MBJ7536698.1 MFS transporter [Marinomonas transparens]
MRTSGILLIIAYLGFISLGLPDAAHGINWPFVKAEFDVPIGWLGIVITAGGIGYLLSSFSVGVLLAKFGIGWLLSISSLLVSMGLFGFAMSSDFFLFSLYAIVIGMGSGAIDAGLNSYAAEHFTAKHMNWLHAAFGVGATLGPLIVTFVLVHGLQNWRLGYGVLACILLLMTAVFVFSRHLWSSDKHLYRQVGEVAPVVVVSQRQALAHPIVRFQIAFFFLYTGFEVGVGQWAFSLMTESRGISVANAGMWVAVYWGALAFGRAIFGFLVERFAIDSLLRFCLMGMVLGALSFCINTTPYASYLGLTLMGFCAAPLFPCMVSQTAKRMEKAYSTHAIGFQMSGAVLGAMSLPFLSGLLGESLGLTLLGVSFVFYALGLWGIFEIILIKSKVVKVKNDIPQPL